MVQTVVMAQELYLKAALVDRGKLAELQQSCELVEAEELYRGAFWYDVRPLTRAWREARGLPADPLETLRTSGYVEQAARERESRSTTVGSYA
jgi:L-rhamnose isomerase/sugar isomerase